LTVSGLVEEVPVGYRAGGWQVTRHIASGSWACVYAARRVQPPRAAEDPPVGLWAALKFLPGGTLSPPQYADLQAVVSEEVRFNEEVDHPRLVRTYETFVIEDPEHPSLHGAVVLAMELATSSLQDVLASVTPPDPAPDAGRVIAEICEALVHVHAQGWVHGDLKPGNVLLMQDGSVRLADFGLARELDGTHAYAPRLGSSDYLPPEWWTERIGAEGIATRTTADIWALGVTAHQLLTGGMFPFVGATSRARGAAARAYAEGHEPLRLADGLAPEWRSIIADCLARDHDARQQHTAAALLPRIEALGGAGAGEGRAPASHHARAWWQRGWKRLAAAALALAAAGAGAVALTGGAAERERPVGAPLRVYNVEVACQRSMSLTCRLGLAGDPYAKYRADNVTARVRHGDRLVAECYITDGTPVRAEKGQPSARWYRVRTPSTTAWLPAVRAWPGRPPAVGRCAR
jgi:serine/threonine-protein kinase